VFIRISNGNYPQSNPVQIPYLKLGILLSSHLLLGLPSDLSSQLFRVYAFLFFPKCDTCPFYLVLPDLIILIASDEQQKL
jgi:hypothetical protein